MCSVTIATIDTVHYPLFTVHYPKMFSLIRIFLICAIGCMSYSPSQASRSIDLSQGLPIPAVPDNLRDPQFRADYLVKHWWDEMDWTNNKYALDTTWMEIAFADYATVLPIATQGDSMQYTIDRLFENASANPKAYALLSDIAAKYLFEPESPVFNEQAYSYFANAQLGSTIISEARRQRLSWEAQMAALNLPGTKVNDFIYEARNGKECGFVSAIVGKPTLTIFYDPDCHDCHNFIQHLSADSTVNNAIADGLCNIAAIAVYESAERWDETAPQMPSNWIVGLDITDVEGNDLFYMPAIPSIIVTDSEANVICKNEKPSDSLHRLGMAAGIR